LALLEEQAKEQASKRKGFSYYLHDLYMPEGRDPEKDDFFPLVDQGVSIHSVKLNRGQQGSSQHLIDLRFAPLFYEYFSSKVPGFTEQQKVNF